ncbi:hypothetical protein JKP88DRAFT_265601, partial [Tribonema minus]
MTSAPAPQQQPQAPAAPERQAPAPRRVIDHPNLKAKFRLQIWVPPEQVAKIMNKNGPLGGMFRDPQIMRVLVPQQQPQPADNAQLKQEGKHPVGSGKYPAPPANIQLEGEADGVFTAVDLIMAAVDRFPVHTTSAPAARVRPLMGTTGGSQNRPSVLRDIQRIAGVTASTKRANNISSDGGKTDTQGTGATDTPEAAASAAAAAAEAYAAAKDEAVEAGAGDGVAEAEVAEAPAASEQAEADAMEATDGAVEGQGTEDVAAAEPVEESSEEISAVHEESADNEPDQQEQEAQQAVEPSKETRVEGAAGGVEGKATSQEETEIPSEPTAAEAATAAPSPPSPPTATAASQAVAPQPISLTISGPASAVALAVETINAIIEDKSTIYEVMKALRLKAPKRPSQQQPQ